MTKIARTEDDYHHTSSEHDKPPHTDTLIRLLSRLCLLDRVRFPHMFLGASSCIDLSQNAAIATSPFPLFPLATTIHDFFVVFNQASSAGRPCLPLTVQNTHSPGQVSPRSVLGDLFPGKRWRNECGPEASLTRLNCCSVDLKAERGFRRVVRSSQVSE
jgi:hypothetical protein